MFRVDGSRECTSISLGCRSYNRPAYPTSLTKGNVLVDTMINDHRSKEMHLHGKIVPVYAFYVSPFACCNSQPLLPAQALTVSDSRLPNQWETDNSYCHAGMAAFFFKYDHSHVHQYMQCTATKDSFVTVSNICFQMFSFFHALHQHPRLFAEISARGILVIPVQLYFGKHWSRVMEFVLVKNPGQTLSVWTHISALFGSHPAPDYQDASALESIRKEFKVRRRSPSFYTMTLNKNTHCTWWPFTTCSFVADHLDNCVR